jgi:class 3 adenylate cyclase
MEFGISGRPPTRYLETASGYLAYQVFGSGERDIMFVTGGISNIDAVWDEPSAVRFFDRLAGLGRVIQYDMRGSGVSDPIPGETIWMPLEEHMADVLAVLDAAGSERAVVYGDTEGGLSAMMLAATNPDRVSALVLVNCEARFLRSDDYPIGMPQEVADALSAQYLAQYGTTGAMLDLTAPSVAGDPRFRAWWTRYQRLAAPLGLVKRTFDWFSQVDLRAVLPLIRMPTLVIARRDARFHRPEYGRYLADHIEGAVLRVVEGADTLPFHAGDFGPTLDHVEEFLTGRSDAPRIDRVLSTVLFTDIVGSTSLASSMGDRRWLDLLQEHDRIARSQLARFRGREVKMTGDGCVASFDGPGRAVACAAAMVEQMATIGLTVRAGIHTGEVEYREGDIGGVGVHIASRVMSQAESGGILVSGTVKDLVVGSGLEFRPCGTFDLKGVPGEWQLFELESLG